MKILVTGSSGLVGSALKHIVSDNVTNKESSGHTYIYLTSNDGDLTDATVVRGLFETHRPDVVVHLAANVGGLFKNMHRKAAMLEDNVLMNTLLLKYARQYAIQKIIVLLSTCVFPDGVEPLVETALHAGPPHPSNEGYAYAKRLMEVHSRILTRQCGIQTVCLTPTNIYGPNDNFNLDDAHVIPALIHRCYLAKKHNQPFVVKGTGKPLRQFIFSRDLATIIHRIIHAPTEHGYHSHLICSPPSDQEVSIEYVARQIAKAMDYEHSLTFDPSYADGQYKKTVEPNPALASLASFAFTPFDTGIRETVAWFLEHVDSEGIRL